MGGSTDPDGDDAHPLGGSRDSAGDEAHGGGARNRIALLDWERDALEVMTIAARDYMLLGAMDERTLRANDDAWRAGWLRPRVLTGADTPDLSVEVLGRRWPHPVMAAPTANHALLHDEAEVATARGLATSRATMAVSTSASRPLRDIVAGLDHWWFQVYLPDDERFRTALVEQVVAAGAEALVLTVDLPVGGRREAPLRASRPSWPEDRTRFLWLDAARRAGCSDSAPGSHLLPVTLDHLEWLAGFGLPVVVKGVLRGDDARRAVDAGAAAIQVSNHGGRQLDGAVPTAVALPEVAAAVAPQVPVIVDGGVRRGRDVATALALGATAVAIGKPVLWGLAVDGSEGVAAVVDTLVDEVDHVMRLLGVANVDELTDDLLT
ncbi:MAG TPA: alpha-hydroxy acid oxidase [Nitriliruptoraceae bacterium]|nr:alpha-hydroxy acid oxidase [Nitriliruptoraceae bacterium]